MYSADQLGYIRSRLYYDSSSPSGLRWAHDVYSGKYSSVLVASKGSVAGAKNVLGYWQVNLFGKLALNHRIIAALHLGLVDGPHQVDHINGNPSDNRLDNLRVCSRKTNMQNTKLRVDSSTGIVGVCLSGSNYIANWQEDGKRKCQKFSIRKYGEQGALNLAKDARARAIAKLNSEGQQYSDRHGNLVEGL